MGNESPLTLSSTQPSSNLYGVKIGENRYLQAPQGLSTEEFKSYLQQYEPDTFRALNAIAEKYPPRVLTDEEREKINNTRLGSYKMIANVKPSWVKQLWQKFENIVMNKTKRPPRVTLDELQDRINKGQDYINDILNGNNDVA